MPQVLHSRLHAPPPLLSTTPQLTVLTPSSKPAPPGANPRVSRRLGPAAPLRRTVCACQNPPRRPRRCPLCRGSSLGLPNANAHRAAAPPPTKGLESEVATEPSTFLPL